MKAILLFLLLLFANLASAQDFVYDSIRGNQTYWRRIKVGQSEKLTGVWYENMGIIVRSKVLLAARVWDGLQENIDYRIDSIKPDTLLFEFNASPPLNMIIYKYYYTDTTFYNFIGIRKAELGSDLFTGQYLFICPIIENSYVNVFEGIGANRKILLTIDGNNIIETNYRDYSVSKQITFQVIKGSKVFLFPKTLEYITDTNENFADSIKIYPNPVTDILNVDMPGNMGVMLRIYNNKPQLLYQEFVNTDNKVINVSNLFSGMYLLVISDYNNGSIITVKKIIK